MPIHKALIFRSSFGLPRCARNDNSIDQHFRRGAALGYENPPGVARDSVGSVDAPGQMVGTGTINEILQLVILRLPWEAGSLTHRRRQMCFTW